jgi:hypothetical protein
MPSGPALLRYTVSSLGRVEREKAFLWMTADNLLGVS